ISYNKNNKWYQSSVRSFDQEKNNIQAQQKKKMVESKTDRIEYLTNELEMLKKEKGDLDSKLIGFQTASKDLDNLLESQRIDKNKEGLGYSVVPLLPRRICLG
nr:hypothetical protein [Tanacetum cinerariifolium]